MRGLPQWRRAPWVRSQVASWLHFRAFSANACMPHTTAPFASLSSVLCMPSPPFFSPLRGSSRQFISKGASVTNWNAASRISSVGLIPQRHDVPSAQNWVEWSRQTAGTPSMRKRRSLVMNLNAVAQKARVSTSTVSRVLNELDVVKSSTRARVMKAAEELNYHPNLHARSLARGKSRILGIIVSNMENPFFLDIYRTLEADARAHGHEVVVANTDYQSQQLVASVQLMLGLRVAGLAVIVSEMDEHLIQTVASSRIPAAFYDVGTPQKNITNIRVDYRKGIKKTVSYLSSLGHRRMAFIGHHSTLGPISERRKAFLESVSRCSPSVEANIFAPTDGLEEGRQPARGLIQSAFHPTSVLCVNSVMDVGAMPK